ncbi:hypothetical protein HYR99_07190 [Candidatus Poribacteria bacterium]|nr:hypothetical protein [Candidatus Poribacteria bacterium]
MRVNFQNQRYSRENDQRLIDAYDAMKRGDWSDDDWKILHDYAWEISRKRCLREGLRLEAASDIADEVALRLIETIRSCRLNV